MDRILIQMPQNPLEFFMAMPVAQAYVFEYLHGVEQRARHPLFQFTFRMDEKYEKYELPLKISPSNMPVFDYTGWTVKARSEFQCFIDFDFERAKKLSRNSGKHIVECLGAMIGCTPRKWPVLPPPTCKQGKGILIVDWTNEPTLSSESRKVQQGIGKDTQLCNKAESETQILLDEILIGTPEAIIGPPSVLTYIASMYQRKVIELFPDMESYTMFNNEGTVDYRAVVGNPDAEHILTAWENMNEVIYA